MTESSSAPTAPAHLIALPPQAPRKHGAFSRRAAALVLRWCGWRVTGEFPDLPRLVIIAAPHSSGWDAVWGMLVKVALGLDVEFMAKREVFWWPLGSLLRALGGFPVDRSATVGVVEQLTERMHKHPRLWLAVAPEGTRRRVGKWKTGFWRVAHDAGVPVVCAAFHYPERRVHIGQRFDVGDDMEADMRAIRDYYQPYVGRHRDTL
jgi:1-acyl-sn-glycerol-3-phosphate acyltransferase